MAARIEFDVQSFSEAAGEGEGTLVLFTDESLALPEGLAEFAGEAGVQALTRLIEVEAFKGKAKASVQTLLPPGARFERAVIVGLGKPDERRPAEATLLGGAAFGALGRAKAATLLMRWPGGDPDPALSADLLLGMRLRAWVFDRYKTKKPDDEETPQRRVTAAVEDPDAAREALAQRLSLAEGVEIARDLVSEPPNILHPEAFAERARELEALGVEVEVLGPADLERIGMRALLGVSQGSEREPRVVVMRWRGAGDAEDRPVALIGKGVTFDTGGISIKPAASMEDMKGDMGGAAAVVGAMHAIASRKAGRNVLGIIGLVENMPDGRAQRPGDIVTSLSGQTIEIINTDAEGRLVLGDLITYVQDTAKPVLMVNLATLTGAILVALGQEHAGLFSNDDALSAALT